MQKEQRAKEDEMAGWHHQSNGHELEQTLGDGEGQGGLVCCNPWGQREPDTTGRLNSNNGFGDGNTEFETFVKHGEWCWEAYWTVVLKDLLLQKTDLG